MYTCHDCGYKTSKTSRLADHMKQRRHGTCKRESTWKGYRRITGKKGNGKKGK
ncbi:MAG: hypothetical protein AAB817_01825 [Patescibacteria group bacterium]